MESKESHQTEVKETVTEVATSTAADVPVSDIKKPSKTPAYLLGAVAIGIGIGAYVLISTPSDPGTRAVITVDGAVITQQEYENSFATAEEAGRTRGLNVADDAIRSELHEQAVTVLINTKLLSEAAFKSGVNVSDDEVTTEIDNLIFALGGADALNTELETLNLSMSDLREDVREQIAVRAYIENETDILAASTTQEEILSYYATLAELNSNLPPFDQMQSQIEAQLISEKQQAAMLTLLEGLRAEATIEINIDNPYKE